MGARVSVWVVPNMEALPCLQINEQTGSKLSTALLSLARSSLISWIPTYYTPLVKPIHSLISAFFPMGRLLGTSRPNSLVCRYRYQSRSFVQGVAKRVLLPVSDQAVAVTATSLPIDTSFGKPGLGGFIDEAVDYACVSLPTYFEKWMLP